ncbi:hypothetical protein INR49_020535 [Caranx melampygus]|nr:hypothetical protein INR49_020535 [Caranx melampygus]
MKPAGFGAMWGGGASLPLPPTTTSLRLSIVWTSGGSGSGRLGGVSCRNKPAPPYKSMGLVCLACRGVQRTQSSGSDSLVLLLPADVPLSPTLKLHQSQSDIMKGAGMKTLVFNICGLNHELADGAEDAPVTRLYIRLSTCEITGSLGGLWLERGQGLDPGREKPKSH